MGEQIWNNADKFGKNAGFMIDDPNDPGNNPPARARLRTTQTKARNQVRDLAIGQSLKLAILDIGLLALFNLVFFVASFVSKQAIPVDKNHPFYDP